MMLLSEILIHPYPILIGLLMGILLILQFQTLTIRITNTSILIGDGIHEIIFFNNNQSYTGSLTFKYMSKLNIPIYNYTWNELTPFGPNLISDSSTALVNPGTNGKTVTVE